MGLRPVRPNSPPRESWASSSDVISNFSHPSWPLFPGCPPARSASPCSYPLGTRRTRYQQPMTRIVQLCLVSLLHIAQNKSPKPLVSVSNKSLSIAAENQQRTNNPSFRESRMQTQPRGRRLSLVSVLRHFSFHPLWRCLVSILRVAPHYCGRAAFHVYGEASKAPRMYGPKHLKEVVILLKWL